MSLQNFVYSVPGTVKCGGSEGPDMQAGDSVKVYLDQTEYPAAPEFILGTVQQPVTAIQIQDPPNTGPLVPGTQYTIEYETDDLNGFSPILEACHVDPDDGDLKGLECISCCDTIQTNLDAVDVRTTALEALPQGTIHDLNFPGITFNVVTPVAPDLAAVPDAEKKEGAQIRCTYDPDSSARSGDEFVVLWSVNDSEIAIDPIIVEWPAGSVVRVENPASSGNFDVTYTDKAGNTTAWRERAVATVSASVDVDGNVVYTFDNKEGLSVSWFGMDPAASILAQGSASGTGSIPANSGVWQTPVLNTAGLLNQITHDSGNDRLVVSAAGRYRVHYHGTVLDQVAETLTLIGISVGGVDPTEEIQIGSRTAGGNPVPFSIEQTVDLANGATVEGMVQGAANSIDVVSRLSIERVK